MAHTMIVATFSTSNCWALSSLVIRLTRRRAILLTNQANTRTPMMTELTISTSNRETLNSPNDKATASSVSTTDSTVSLRELSASLAPSAASSPPCS